MCNVAFCVTVGEADHFAEEDEELGPGVCRCGVCNIRSDTQVKRWLTSVCLTPSQLVAMMTTTTAMMMTVACSDSQ
eukprot:3981138-Karenia_brevis.AAC.1